MKSTRTPQQSGSATVPTVMAIIVLSLGGLAWEWHRAHHTPAKHESISAHHHGHHAHRGKNAAGAPSS